MKVSLNTIRQFIDFELPPVDELVSRINQQLGGVEEVIDLGAKYKDARIVRVVECEKHPNADKLSVCKIDAGEKELIQVVCGAPNARADMWAVWLPPDSTVPASYDDKEPFVLDARELRGVMSHGMLAAGDELAINSDHEGIIEITDYDIKIANKLHQGDSLMQLKAGDSFAKVFGLDDTIIDIENKMFTHRPDCFGQLGVAREVSAILGGVTTPDEETADTRYKNPDWYWNAPGFQVASGLELKTFNDAKEKVPRVMFCAMKDVTVKSSPLWLQCALVAMGGKPINNIVDATNYVMLMTAQPTHAYDYDKLRGHTIGARMAQDGEKAPLLNGKSYVLDKDDIVIADGEGAIGVAGIMGGGNSEVSLDTKNIVLEVATFDMYTVRKSSMRHGLFTDALTRFNKGQSPLQNGRIMNYLMTLMKDLGDAVQASDISDIADRDWNREVSLSGEIEISQMFINDRLGVDLTTGQIGNLLRRANFASHSREDNETVLLITAPFWRTDIELPEDIVEEVGRLYGFDKLPRELPSRSTKPAPKNQLREVKQLIRESMSRMGGNEVLTYSFVHENIIKRSERDVSEAFRLSNALSPELQYYRLNALPSLLDKVHANIKAGYDEFLLFEIAKGHAKHAIDEDGLPYEQNHIAAVYTSKNPHDGAAYYQTRRFVNQLAADLNVPLCALPLSDDREYPMINLKRSARIVECGNEQNELGFIMELNANVRKAFKLPEYTACFVLELDQIALLYDDRSSHYAPLSKYPSVTQDISLKVATDQPYEAVVDEINTTLTRGDEPLLFAISPLTIYQAEDDTGHKIITLRIEVVSHEKTLTTDEVSAMLDAAAASAEQKLDAKRV